MRFLLCLMIWIVFVGGLFAYTSHRDANLPEGPPPQKIEAHVEGDYLLELTPTFSIEQDPFALQSDSENTPSIDLRLNGQIITFPDMEMNRGKVIQIKDLPDMIAGFNEFYIKASPPISETDRHHGMRLRLLEGEYVIADETIWAGDGAIVSGTVNFKLAIEKDHHHDH